MDMAIVQTEGDTIQTEPKTLAEGLEDGLLGGPQTQETGIHCSRIQMLQCGRFVGVEKPPGQTQGVWTGTVRLEIDAEDRQRVGNGQNRHGTTMGPVEIEVGPGRRQ